MRALKSLPEKQRAAMMDNNVRIRHWPHPRAARRGPKKRLRWAEEATAGIPPGTTSHPGPSTTSGPPPSGGPPFRGCSPRCKQKHPEPRSNITETLRLFASFYQRRTCPTPTWLHSHFRRDAVSELSAVADRLYEIFFIRTLTGPDFRGHPFCWSHRRIPAPRAPLWRA